MAQLLRVRHPRAGCRLLTLEGHRMKEDCGRSWRITYLLHRHKLLLKRRSGVVEGHRCRWEDPNANVLLNGGQRYKGRNQRRQDHQQGKHLPAPPVVILGPRPLMDRLGITRIGIRGRKRSSTEWQTDATRRQRPARSDHGPYSKGKGRKGKKGSGKGGPAS